MENCRLIKEGLEQLCINEKNQFLRSNGGRVSAVPVGKPDVIECNSVWDPSELYYAISQHAPKSANAFVMGEPQDMKYGFYKSGIQFYKIS